MTQNNLGLTFWRLGQREASTDRLEDAINAFRNALQEYTRDRVPLDWAMTQNNLGLALATLGERETGTAHLEEAVRAYRAALQEKTRDRIPLEWAETQSNLGIALRLLGERQNNLARLREACEAFALCLSVTDTVWPPEWVANVRDLCAQTQSEITRRQPTASSP